VTTPILYAIYGASGCGRGVAPLLEEQVQPQPEAEIVFIDDGCAGEVVNSLPVLSYEQYLRSQITEKRVTIAIANGVVRKRLAERCVLDGIKFHRIESKQHVSMRDVMVDEGAIFSPFTTLTSNIRIGAHFHCNIGSYVEHDCIIGDFVTFAPGVKCNGNVHIGDGAYIGSGAVIKQGTPDKPLVIGAGATVGMGAVVTKDVAPGDTVIGNPARPFVE